MKSGGYLIYKCAHCAEEEKNTHVPDISIAIMCLIYNREMPESWCGARPEPKYTHICTNGHVGICELVGGEYDR